MELTASQLATLVNGTVDGDENVKVSTFARIEEGIPVRSLFRKSQIYSFRLFY